MNIECFIHSGHLERGIGGCGVTYTYYAHNDRGCDVQAMDRCVTTHGGM